LLCSGSSKRTVALRRFDFVETIISSRSAATVQWSSLPVNPPGQGVISSTSEGSEESKRSSFPIVVPDATRFLDLLCDSAR
jgi:hypothetical protein